MRHKEQPQAVSIVARKEHKTPTMNDFNSHELKIATDRRCHYAISSNIALPPGANGISTASCLSGQDLSGTSRPTTDILGIVANGNPVAQAVCLCGVDRPKEETLLYHLGIISTI